jgi:hypothetical protein
VNDLWQRYFALDPRDQAADDSWTEFEEEGDDSTEESE